MHVDSIDKIVQSYFAAVAAVSFTYKGTTYSPKLLTVTPSIFRGFTCPPNCGGCCPRFSLDYLPTEGVPDKLKLNERMVEFDGRAVRILSDLQDDHQNHHCRNLNHENGRCGVHGRQPFSCDFELIRAFHSADSVRLSQQLFGRGWALLRVDEKRGALCELTPVTKSTMDDVIRKLMRLKQWADYFGLRTHVHTIIRWAQGLGQVPYTQPLRLEPNP